MLICHHYRVRLSTIIFVFDKSFINNFINFGIQKWLNLICKSIDIITLELVLNKKDKSRIDEFYLEAKNLIYQDLYINNIIIKIYDCNFKFNYRNHIVYSDNLIINCFITIDSKNLKNTLFSNKFQNLRLKIEKVFTEGESLSNLFIFNNLITFNYVLDKLNKEITLSLFLKESLIFLEDLINRKMILLPLDKNIKVNSCYVKNEMINIDLSSKVIFDT